MIEPISIPVGEIAPHVRKAFEGDNDLLSTYHISPGDLDHCVSDTLRCIYENADHYKEDMVCYKVALDGDPIGYTIVLIDENNPCELYSFGINIEHRNAALLQEWIGKVKEKIGKVFFTILWNKNTRAINFFKKNGFKEETLDSGVDLDLKTLLICRQVAS